MALKKLRKSKLQLAIMIAFPLMWGGNPAFAETSINTMVCSVDAQAFVSITTPVSDSTVNSPTVVIEGNIRHSNQVDVVLDGRYDQTVALRPSQTAYRLTLETIPGTHTIRVEANGVCGSRAAAESIFTIPANLPVEPIAIEKDDEGVQQLEPLTTLDGQLLEVATIQDTDRFFEQNGFSDSTAFSTRQQPQIALSFASIVSTARQYTSSVIFAASAVAIVAAAAPIQAGAAATSLFGVPRRLLIIIAIIGAISAVFFGI